MEILKELEPKVVARDFYDGDTHVRISTDYCRSPEEVPEILHRIARDAQRAFMAQYIAEQRKADENEAP